MLSHRVWQNWGYNDLPQRLMERQSAALRELILGLADQEYEDEEWIVFRTRPVDAWDHIAIAACNEGVVEPKRGERQKEQKTNDAQPAATDEDRATSRNEKRANEPGTRAESSAATLQL
jgi:hypothetical protein